MRGLIIPVTLVAMAAGCNRSTERPSSTATSEGSASQAPAGKVAERHDLALVRFVNATAGAPAVDVWSGDAKAFPNVSYRTVTAYRTLPGERHEFKVRRAGQDTAEPLAESSEGLGDGKHYTVVALKKDDGSVTIHTFKDEMTMPAVGKAKVRVIHAAPNVGDIDVLRASGDLFDGVDFDSATDYKEVASWRGALLVRKDTGGGYVLRLDNVKLQANRMYTVIVTGGKKGEAVVVEDEPAQPGVS